MAAGRVTVRGWAWSGDGAIECVEVAVDGGESWREARLLPANAQYAWRGWELDWDAAAPGRHVLRARAADSSGNVQPDRVEWNRFGYGNNAVQTVYVTVV